MDQWDGPIPQPIPWDCTPDISGYVCPGQSKDDSSAAASEKENGIHADGHWASCHACVCVCVCVYTHAVVSNSATPWTAAREAPLSMGFSRLEYWSELPFPPLWDLPGLGIKPGSLRLLHWQGILDHHATREVPYHAYRTRNDDFSRDVSAVLHFRRCLNGQII